MRKILKSLLRLGRVRMRDLTLVVLIVLLMTWARVVCFRSLELPWPINLFLRLVKVRPLHLTTTERRLSAAAGRLTIWQLNSLLTLLAHELAARRVVAVTICLSAAAILLEGVTPAPLVGEGIVQDHAWGVPYAD